MTVALTIAGSDSGGGAGIQADLKTFEAHGVFGASAITSVTAQNTRGVRGVYDIPIEGIAAQINAVLDDFPVAAVKIGMLSSREIVAAVADLLRRRCVGVPVVLDPVMVATSGDRLLRGDAVAAIVEELMPLATLVTPNVAEAALLAGAPVEGEGETESVALRIRELGAAAVLVKGGDLRRDGGMPPEAADFLLDGGEGSWLRAPFIPVSSTHGTGCTLSSAIAANLALGYPLAEAVRRAKDYVHAAIAAAPGLGAGHGPLRHHLPGFDGEPSGPAAEEPRP